MTYAQIFLCADEEQLNTGGVILLQGVFEPLPADTTTQLYRNPTAGINGNKKKKNTFVCS